jgi:hypothetical protein
MRALLRAVWGSSSNRASNRREVSQPEPTLLLLDHSAQPRQNAMPTAKEARSTS